MAAARDRKPIKPRGTPWWAWLAGALAIAGAIGIGIYVARTGKPTVSELPGASASAPAPPAATPVAAPIQHPIEQAAVEPGTDDASLPVLDASDAAVFAALGTLAGDGIASLMNPEHVIQRIVATIDGLPRQKLAADALPVRGVSGAFVATRDGAATAVDPKNYARYDAYGRIARALDTNKVVAWYVHHYASFQQAYRELGYPDGYFNDRLVVVIDHLLATPDLPQPPALTQPNVLYEYADPTLEARSAGQKLLMRSGPANEAAIKAKLREIRAALVGTEMPHASPESAPAPPGETPTGG